MYTDTIDVVPSQTTMGTRVDIVARVCDASSLPKNVYSTSGHGATNNNNKWASVSRAKLDVVEDILVQEGEPVIWIDLRHACFYGFVECASTRGVFVGGGLSERKRKYGFQEVRGVAFSIHSSRV